MKRLLMLGGSLYQTYAIKEAVKLGYYVITCDYLPAYKCNVCLMLKKKEACI